MRGAIVFSVLFAVVLGVTAEDGLVNTTVIPPSELDDVTVSPVSDGNVTREANKQDTTAIPTIPSDDQEGVITAIPTIPSDDEEVVTTVQPLSLLNSLLFTDPTWLNGDDDDEDPTEEPENDDDEYPTEESVHDDDEYPTEEPELDDQTTPKEPCDDENDEEPTEDPEINDDEDPTEEPELDDLGDETTPVVLSNDDDITIPPFVGGGARRALRRFRRSLVIRSDDETIDKCIKTIEDLKTDVKTCVQSDEFQNALLNAAKKNDLALDENNVDLYAFYAYAPVVGKFPVDIRSICNFLVTKSGPKALHN